MVIGLLLGNIFHCYKVVRDSMTSGRDEYEGNSLEIKIISINVCVSFIGGRSCLTSSQPPFFNLVRMFEGVAAGPGARKAELVA